MDVASMASPMPSWQTLEAALLSNHQDGLIEALTVWIAKQDGNRDQEGQLSTQTLQRFVQIFAERCSSADWGGCFVMSEVLVHFVRMSWRPEGLQTLAEGVQQVLPAALQSLRGCRMPQVEASELPRYLFVRHVCGAALHLLNCGLASAADEFLRPSRTVTQGCDDSPTSLLLAAAASSVHELSHFSLPDKDQRKLQLLISFVRLQASRAAADLLASALADASTNVRRQCELDLMMGKASIDLVEALLHAPPDPRLQEPLLELLYRGVRRLRCTEDVPGPSNAVERSRSRSRSLLRQPAALQRLEEVAGVLARKSLQETATRDFRLRKGDLARQLSQRAGGLLGPCDCHISWGRLSTDRAKATFTEYSLSLEIDEGISVEVPWACIELPEVLLPEDDQALATSLFGGSAWPLQFWVDCEAALMVGAVQGSQIGDRVDDMQAALNFAVPDMPAQEFVPRLRQLLYEPKAASDNAARQTRTGAAAAEVVNPWKAMVKARSEDELQAPALAQRSSPLPRRVTRSVTRSMSARRCGSSGCQQAVRPEKATLCPEGRDVPASGAKKAPSAAVKPALAVAATERAAAPLATRKPPAPVLPSAVPPPAPRAPPASTLPVAAATLALAATLAPKTPPAPALPSVAVPPAPRTPPAPALPPAAATLAPTTPPVPALPSAAAPPAPTTPPVPALPPAAHPAPRTPPPPPTLPSPAALPAAGKPLAAGLSDPAALAGEAASLGIMHPEALRELCRERGVNPEGLRHDLISRLLIQRLAAPAPGSRAPVTPSFAPFSALRKSELRAACGGLGLPETGSSNDLVYRLASTAPKREPASAPATPAAPASTQAAPAATPAAPAAPVGESKDVAAAGEAPARHTASAAPKQLAAAAAALQRFEGMKKKDMLQECRSRSLSVKASRPKADLLAHLVGHARAQSEAPDRDVPVLQDLPDHGLYKELVRRSLDELRLSCQEQGLLEHGSREQLALRLSAWKRSGSYKVREEAAPKARENSRRASSPCPRSAVTPAPASPQAPLAAQMLTALFQSSSRRPDVAAPPEPSIPTALLPSRQDLAGEMRLEPSSPDASTPTRRRLRSKTPDATRKACESPRCRVRGKSPMPESFRSSTPVRTPPRKNSGAEAAVRLLLLLRPEQLQKECEKKGLSPRRSPHAMACRLVAARAAERESPGASSSCTEVLDASPYQLSPAAKSRATAPQGASPRSPSAPHSPRGRAASQAAGRGRQAAKSASPAKARQAAKSASPVRARQAAKSASPVRARQDAKSPPALLRRGRSCSRSRSRPAPSSPGRTGNRGSPSVSTRARSSASSPPVPAAAASVLCRPHAASPRSRRGAEEASPPSTPERPSCRPASPSQRSGKSQTPGTGAKPHRGAPARSSSRARSRSPGRRTQKSICNGRNKDGMPCPYAGKSRPSGALFFYCAHHSSSWSRYERR
eukprot:TRINITY_DN15076_c0_g1_i1.p1 TRINITY_DN15076_c0_g1~~TRINITY_DN15076_c0_g1_i1.p1  ORF type:complete len:1440 (+),score=308.98 TRINITY_DN15076_c0_g1_i1:51-4370(+)